MGDELSPIVPHGHDQLLAMLVNARGFQEVTFLAEAVGIYVSEYSERSAADTPYYDGIQGGPPISWNHGSLDLQRQRRPIRSGYAKMARYCQLLIRVMMRKLIVCRLAGL